MKNLLLSLPTQGFLWCILLFSVCIIGVHFTLLARLGATYCSEKQKQREDKAKEEKEKSAPAEKTQQEPIYYIVERKQRRAKPSYGEPKEIRFKPTD